MVLVCEVCRLPFHANRKDVRQCSSKCRQSARREIAGVDARFWRDKAEHWQAEAEAAKRALAQARTEGLMQAIWAEVNSRLSETLRRHPEFSEATQKALLERARRVAASVPGLFDLESWGKQLHQEERANITAWRGALTLEGALRELGLPPTATREEALDAYRQLAREHHPDLNPAGAARMLTLNAAMETIKRYLVDTPQPRS